MNDEIFQLIDQHCTLDQIQDLLRKHKEDNPEEIRITAPTKAQVLENVKHAISAQVLHPEEALNLLRESEENGYQHIFYFHPKTENVTKNCSDAQKIASSLWGDDWESSMNFPRTETIPHDFVWADFRVGDISKRKPKDWFIKVYGLERNERFTREDTEGDEIVRRFKLVDQRVVCLIRWNHPDLLELRVPRASSKSKVKARYESLWRLLGPGINLEDFTPWTLEQARTRLLVDHEKHLEVYTLGDTQFLDSAQGRATFSSRSEEESIFEEPSRKQAIESFVASGSPCDRLVVRWKIAGKDNGQLKELATVVGGGPNDNPNLKQNEVIVLPRTDSRTIDYVTDQLRKFNK